jgi:hypothetical protein
MTMKNTICLILPLLCLCAGAADAQMDMPPQGMAPPPQGYVQQPPVVYAQQPPVMVAQSYCQPYTDSFTMGGEKRITRGTACMHPDGSWELHPAQAAANYVMRGGAVYLVPVQPFARIVIKSGHAHPHHHYDR